MSRREASLSPHRHQSPEPPSTDSSDGPAYVEIHPTHSRSSDRSPSPLHKHVHPHHRSTKSLVLQSEEGSPPLHPTFRRLQGHNRKPFRGRKEHKQIPASRGRPLRSESSGVLLSAVGGSAAGSSHYDPEVHLGPRFYQVSGSTLSHGDSPYSCSADPRIKLNVPAPWDSTGSSPSNLNPRKHGDDDDDKVEDEDEDIPIPTSPRPRARSLPVLTMGASSSQHSSREWPSSSNSSCTKQFSGYSDSNPHFISFQRDHTQLSGRGSQDFSLDRYPSPPSSYMRSAVTNHKSSGEYRDPLGEIQEHKYQETLNDRACSSGFPPLDLPSSPQLGYISDSFNDDDDDNEEEEIDELQDDDAFYLPILSRPIQDRHGSPVLYRNVGAPTNQRRSALPSLQRDNGGYSRPAPQSTELLPRSVWKLQIAQFNRSLSTRGLRFPGYTPSRLGPNWESYHGTW